MSGLNTKARSQKETSLESILVQNFVRQAELFSLIKNRRFNKNTQPTKAAHHIRKFQKVNLSEWALTQAQRQVVKTIQIVFAACVLSPLTKKKA